MKNLLHSLSHRIGGGYALMVLLLAITVVATLQQVGTVRSANEQLDQVRMPVVRASTELLNGANHSSAALRGWVFLQDSSFHGEYQLTWKDEIELPLRQLSELLPFSTDPTAPERLTTLKKAMDHLRGEQLAALNAPDRRTAMTMVVERSSPAVAEARGIIEALVDKQQELMRADMTSINEQVHRLNVLQWLILVLGSILAVILAAATTRSIVRPVNSAVLAADTIAHGDLETEHVVGGTRELDVLGTALRSMRDSLRARRDETARQAWLAEGQRRMDEVLRGEKDLSVLSSEMVTALAEYSGAHVATAYLMDDEREGLILQGTYALSRDAVPFFAHGEGLVGQVALHGKSRLLQHTDQGHLRIASSLVDTRNMHILIMPFLFEGQVLGVVELGRLTPYEEKELEFVNTAMSGVAVALNTAMNRTRIRELLEETQRQSEELQLQQEELQQTNEELEEQAQQLKVQQEELQVTNEELAEQTRTVARRNEALEKARLEVEQKAAQLEITSRYKSEFLANMSHELRTPLNSLLILSGHLARNKRGNLQPDQVECAQVIARSGNDLLNLINDILDLSKVEAGKMELRVTPLKHASLVEEIRSMFSHVARDKGLDFDVQVDSRTPDTILSDRQRVMQVVRNLVSNAIKFTNTGKVTVRFKRAASDEGWAIDVEDTGIGISPEQKDLIFEAFQQADGGTARKFGGTGLGLSISRELARLLGGHITLESRLTKGSTFTFTLPAMAPEPEVATAEKFPAPQGIISHIHTGHPSIADQRDSITADDQVLLIIEDDMNFARVLADQARQRGFKFIAAGSGEDGLILVRKYLPHAILLDMDLPGMDGHAVLREIKGDPHLRHIPVHILSVLERSMDPLHSGAVEYLTKPVDQEQLDSAFARLEDMVHRKMKNLLIVEDDEAQRLAIRTLIGNGDVKCLEAGSAAEGLAILRNQPVDCVVLDIGLPDVSGSQLLKLYKETLGAALPPIIVYTGRDLSEEENDELRLYAETIIVKGIRSEERLLDETALFLHRAVKDLPGGKQAIIMDLHDPEVIFKDLTVLVVDDDVRNIFALNKVLTAKGCTVLRAENGLVALQTLKEAPRVDLVLMDIMMPGMDGYTCMRTIRQERRWADLPIIALTAKAMKEDRRKCMDAGATDYISKPLDTERLFALMRIWVKRQRA
jgi:signal transduction histidine kinase/CheY-like chemotaxis protein/CHASE3 domain sensor protein